MGGREGGWERCNRFRHQQNIWLLLGRHRKAGKKLLLPPRGHTSPIPERCVVITVQSGWARVGAGEQGVGGASETRALLSRGGVGGRTNSFAVSSGAAHNFCLRPETNTNPLIRFDESDNHWREGQR